MLQPVPWSKKLLPQYNQQETKIGYLKKYIKSIRLDIDFLPSVVSQEDVYHFMSSYKHIKEVSSSERAPTHISWWRHNEGEVFNTLQIVIRGESDFGTIYLNEKSSKFFQKIIDGAYLFE